MPEEQRKDEPLEPLEPLKDREVRKNVEVTLDPKDFPAFHNTLRQNLPVHRSDDGLTHWWDLDPVIARGALEWVAETVSDLPFIAFIDGTESFQGLGIASLKDDHCLMVPVDDDHDPVVKVTVLGADGDGLRTAQEFCHLRDGLAAHLEGVVATGRLPRRLE